MIKTIILAIIILFAVICAIVLGVDIAFYVKNEIYAKYHIGRWESDESWYNAVLATTKKWAEKTPVVRITDSERYVLWDIYKGKYKSQSIQSWQTASLVLALIDSNESDAAKAVVSDYISHDGSWKKNPVAVDSGLLSYSFMKAVEDVNSIKPAMDYMLNLILSFKDDSGLICYNRDDKNPEKYVDALGLVCPFLTYYARMYDQPEYEDLAIDQLKFYHEFGLLDNQLPNHAINSVTKQPLGVYGWGRGVAWYLIGVLGAFKECTSNENKALLSTWLNDAAMSYLAYQREDGGFGSILQRKTTYDSSATAFLAYYYFQCAELFGNDTYKTVAEKCLSKLKMVTGRNGAVDYCQGDTKDIGVFAQYYDIMPFAQGYLLRAIKAQKG